MSINTVFIIGAGASSEAELPTGNKLKSIIAQLLDIRFDFDRLESGDRIIFNALRKLIEGSSGSTTDLNSYLQEAGNISNALPQASSIDSYIDAHAGNHKIAMCGKLAIVRSILAAEKNSLLHYDRLTLDSNINFGSLEKTWYILFFQLLIGIVGKIISKISKRGLNLLH